MLRGAGRPATIGLRGQLVAALVFTSAVSLAVAAVAILSPLEQRLRRNTGTTLVVAADSVRASYADHLREGSDRTQRAQLRHLNASLARRTGASATLLSARHGVIVTSDQDAPAQGSDAARALADDRTTRAVVNESLIVAAPLRARGRHYAIVLRKRLTEVNIASGVVRRGYVAGAIVGLLVALALGIGLSSALLRRLRRLHRSVLVARRDGAAAIPREDPRGDEIGELSRAFAAMQADVRRQEHARRAFVATASHELRTPLASLQTTLELLVDDLDDESPDVNDARGQVQQAYGQARRLSGLAEDLLDLSRLDAEVELREETVEVAELALAVGAEFAARAAEARTSITVQSNGSALAEGDPDAIARILRILIDNALRFAPPGRQVRVAIDSQGSHDEGPGDVIASVHDDGPGVQPEERELIFERFRRGVRTGDAGGFGLGLAIARELAVRLGGGLHCEASVPEGGATFVLRLRGAA